MLSRIIFFFNLYWKIYTLIVLLLITFFSLYPLKQAAIFPSNDKILHLIAYAALSICLGLRKPEKYILILIFFSIYSGLIEIIQPYVNRFMEVEDFIFNNVGLIVGFVFGVIIKKIS